MVGKKDKKEKSIKKGKANRKGGIVNQQAEISEHSKVEAEQQGDQEKRQEKKPRENTTEPVETQPEEEADEEVDEELPSRRGGR